MELKCNEADFLMHLAVDDELEGPQADTLRDHLKACQECRARLELLKAEAALLGSTLAESIAPEVPESRLKLAVRKRAVRRRRVTLAWQAAAVFAAGFLVAAYLHLASAPGIYVKPSGSTRWHALSAKRALASGDTIRTMGRHRAVLRVAPRTEIALDEKTTVTFEPREQPVLSIQEGHLWISVGSPGDQITVNAPGAAEVTASLSEFGMRFSKPAGPGPLASPLIISSAYATQEVPAGLVVTVLKGKVTVRGTGFEEILPAGQRLALSPERGIMSISEIDAETAVEEFYWTRLFPDPFAAEPEETSIKIKRYKYVRLNPFVGGMDASTDEQGTTNPFETPAEDRR